MDITAVQPILLLLLPHVTGIYCPLHCDVVSHQVASTTLTPSESNEKATRVMLLRCRAAGPSLPRMLLNVHHHRHPYALPQVPSLAALASQQSQYTSIIHVVTVYSLLHVR